MLVTRKRLAKTLEKLSDKQAEFLSEEFQKVKNAIWDTQAQLHVLCKYLGVKLSENEPRYQVVKRKGGKK